MKETIKWSVGDKDGQVMPLHSLGEKKKDLHILGIMHVTREIILKKTKKNLKRKKVILYIIFHCCKAVTSPIKQM